MGSILRNYRNALEGVLDHYNMTLDLIANMPNVLMLVNNFVTLSFHLLTLWLQVE